MRGMQVLICSLFPVVCSGGCGGEKLYPVKGTVTYAGKPVPKGTIYFDPDETKGTKGVQGSATITDGKFDTAQEGRPITGGTYTIRILGFDGQAANEKPMGNAIFPEYTITQEIPNAPSELTIDVRR